MNKEPGKFPVIIDHFSNNGHRDSTEGRGLKCHRTRYVWLLCEVSSVTEILYRTNEAQNLNSTANTFFKFLYFAFEQTPQILGFIAFCIDKLILLKSLNVGNYLQ